MMADVPLCSIVVYACIIIRCDLPMTIYNNSACYYCSCMSVRYCTMMANVPLCSIVVHAYDVIFRWLYTIIVYILFMHVCAILYMIELTNNTSWSTI